MDGTSESRPVACTLTPKSQREETRRFRAEIAPHVIGRERLKDGARLTFRSTPELRESIERLVELDKGCCTFLDHRVEDNGSQLTLEVTSEGSGVPLAREFLSVLAPKTERRWGVGLKAGALIGACGLACTAPFLFGAVGLGVLGVGAGAMLAEIVTLGLVVMAVGAYWYYKRKKPLSVEGTPNENRCGC